MIPGGSPCFPGRRYRKGGNEGREEGERVERRGTREG